MAQKNWRVVASHLKERTPKQCRERWINHLDPGIIKGKLTEEEWNIVIESQEELGNRWSEIAKLLPGRTPNQIKNVWHAMMRRETKQRKPKRKVSMIIPGIEIENPSSESDEISESDEWESSKRRRLLSYNPASAEDNPMSRLDALVAIANNLYELEGIQDHHVDDEQFDSEDSLEDMDDSNDPSDDRTIHKTLNDQESEEEIHDVDNIESKEIGSIQSLRPNQIRENVNIPSAFTKTRCLNDLLYADAYLPNESPAVNNNLQTHWHVVQV